MAAVLLAQEVLVSACSIAAVHGWVEAAQRWLMEGLMNKRIDQLLILLGTQDSVILPRTALSNWMGSAF